MAGYIAVNGQICNRVFEYSLSKDSGWTWQVDMMNIKPNNYLRVFIITDSFL